MKRSLIIWLVIASTFAHANDDVIGCYAVHAASPPGSAEAKSIRLTNQAITLPWGAGSTMRVVPVNSTDKFDYSAAYWAREKDTVVITFTNNGLSGTEIRARQTGVGLRGTMTRFWDFGPSSTDAREVVLIRAACTSSR